MSVETKWYWQRCTRCGRETIPGVLAEAGQRICAGLDVALCDVLSGHRLTVGETFDVAALEADLQVGNEPYTGWDDAPRVANPDGSPTQATLDALAGSGRDPIAFAAATVDPSLCADCGHLKAQHQTGEGPWTGFCYAIQDPNYGPRDCECEAPR